MSAETFSLVSPRRRKGSICPAGRPGGKGVSSPNSYQEMGLLVRPSVRSRVELGGTSHRPIVLDDSDSADDVPLIKNRASRAPATSLSNPIKTSILNTLRAYRSGESGRSTQSRASEAVKSPQFCMHSQHSEVQRVGIAKNTPTPSSPTRSLNDKKQNTTPAFQFISRDEESSRRYNAFLGNVVVSGRVPRFQRLFTDLSLEEVDGLVPSTGEVDASKTGGSSSTSGGELVGKRKRKNPEWSSSRSGVGMSKAKIHDDGTESSANGDGEDIDVYAASPVAAKKRRLADKEADYHARTTGTWSSLVVPGSTRQEDSLVYRTARSTPATEIIDLTSADPAPAPPIKPQPMTPFLADRLFPKSTTPPQQLERSAFSRSREAIFLKGFLTQQWLGGLTLRAATTSVNAALRSNIPLFTAAEGKLCSRALFAQGKLAIRHGLVYHLSCDPGVDAAPPTVTDGPVSVSPAQRVMQECRAVPYRSPFGKIKEKRIRIFEDRLWSAVHVEETLFLDKVETVGRCVEVLKEWMGEDGAFTAREVRAGFEVLERQGRVVWEGQRVRLLGLE